MGIQAWWDRRAAASLGRMYPNPYERDIATLMREQDPARLVPRATLLEAADGALAILMEHVRADGMPVLKVPVFEGRSIQSSRRGHANSEWRVWWCWPQQIDVPVPVRRYSWGDSRADPQQDLADAIGAPASVLPAQDAPEGISEPEMRGEVKGGEAPSHNANEAPAGAVGGVSGPGKASSPRAAGKGDV